MEKVIHFDKQLLVYLNSLGSESFDFLWLIITKQLSWTPYFLIVFYLLFRKIGWKQLVLLAVVIAVMITCTDQFANFIKLTTHRLRPCNDLEINQLIRIVKCSDTFSFYSAHACNSMASTVLVFQLMRKYYAWSFLMFLFPFIFAYSRIYLGMHFPSDILTGYLVGTTAGLLFYKLYIFLSAKYIKKENPL